MLARSHDLPRPPAVYDERLVAAVRVCAPDPPEEVQERSGMTWDAKVRPRDEVVLTNFTSLIRNGLGGKTHNQSTNNNKQQSVNNNYHTINQSIS